MTNKRKNARKKMRQILQAVKKFAAFLDWLVRFILAVWELLDKFSG